MSAAAPAPLDKFEALQRQVETLTALLVQQAANAAPPVPVPAPVTARVVRELYDAYVRHLGEKARKYHATHRLFFTDFVFEFEGREISLGEQPWTRLTPQMGHAWWAALRELPVKSKGKIKSASAGYCNRIRTTLSGMFTWHRDQADKADSRVRGSSAADNVSENPIHRWPRAGKEELGKRTAGFQDEAQFADFLKHAHPTLAELMTMAVWCGGMRHTEVLELRWSFVNWADKTITLPEWFVKNRVARTFPVTDACMAILERRKATRRSEFVFPSPDSPVGAPISDSTLDHWVQDARAGWKTQLTPGNEDVVFHHCRHTFAKWSLLLGDPASLVMEYGGWLSFDVFKGYAKANTLMIEQSRANKNRTIREAIDTAVGKPTAPARRGAHRARFETRKPREEATE